MDDLPEHARIVRGRSYASETVDGIYEAIATEQAMYELDLRLGEVVLVRDTAERVLEPLRVRIVGTFAPTGSGDPQLPPAGSATPRARRRSTRPQYELPLHRRGA
jgi:putative ABC transport system permease protein